MGRIASECLGEARRGTQYDALQGNDHGDRLSHLQASNFRSELPWRRIQRMAYECSRIWHPRRLQIVPADGLRIW